MILRGPATALSWVVALAGVASAERDRGEAAVAVLVTAADGVTLPGIRRVVRKQLAWGMALQSSIVVATINGVRGRWNVWQ